MGEDDEDIADGDLFERDVDDIGAGAAVRDAGHAFDEGGQDGGGPLHGIVLEGSAARKHEDDNGADEILFE